jgi:hypothetical protein
MEDRGRAQRRDRSLNAFAIEQIDGGPLREAVELGSRTLAAPANETFRARQRLDEMTAREARRASD